jgi:hypothetical protein
MVSNIEKTVKEAEWELKDHPIVSGFLVACSVAVNLAGDLVYNPKDTCRKLLRGAKSLAGTLPYTSRNLAGSLSLYSSRILPN